jgi:hypothetical protein
MADRPDDDRQSERMRSAIRELNENSATSGIVLARIVTQQFVESNFSFAAIFGDLPSPGVRVVELVLQCRSGYEHVLLAVRNSDYSSAQTAHARRVSNVGVAPFGSTRGVNRIRFGTASIKHRPGAR